MSQKILLRRNFDIDDVDDDVDDDEDYDSHRYLMSSSSAHNDVSHFPVDCIDDDEISGFNHIPDVAPCAAVTLVPATSTNFENTPACADTGAEPTAN